MGELSTIEADGVRVPALFCPGCRNLLEQVSEGYICRSCDRLYPIVEGFPSFVDRRVTVDSFDASAFTRLLKIEQRHFWHVGRCELIFDVISRNIPHSSDCRMLEIGCGNGGVLDLLRRNNIDMEGGDIFIEGLRCCRERTGSAPLYQIDVLALPFKEEYEIIGLFDVLEHIEDDEKALSEINVALKKEGHLILTVPAFQVLWSQKDETARHRRRYSKKNLIAKLELSGFSVHKITYFVCFLFPLLAFMRLIGRLFYKQKDQDGGSTDSIENKIIPIVNQFFLLSLRIEKYLIRNINLPFGASIIVTAKKIGATS